MEEHRQYRSLYHRWPTYVAIALGLLAVAPLILKPFANVRETGHPPNCMSNLKQIGFAMQYYAQDYDDYLPAASMPGPAGDIPSGYSWRVSILPYLKDKKLFICPGPRPTSLRERLPWNRPPEGAYGMNVVHAQAGGPEPPGANPRGQAQSTIASPAELLLVTDVTAGEYLLTHPSNAPGFVRSDAQATRHGGGARYLYADGHVKCLKPEDIPCTRERCAWAIQGRH